MNTSQDKDVAVVQVDLCFHPNEPLTSLEEKVKAMHRSIMSNAQRDDVLTVIRPTRGDLRQNTVSSSSSSVVASKKCVAARDKHLRRKCDTTAKPNNKHVIRSEEARHVSATSKTTLSNKNHFQREMQLALAADKQTRSLLQRQQVIHML